MRFLHLRLRQFRNIDFAEIELEADRTFLVGANGQGKSNLLEALGLITALRSFRTQRTGALARRGAPGYAGLYTVDHDRQGETTVKLEQSGKARTVEVDGEPVRRLGDFIGRFPVVPLHAGDLMLLRGSPAERRRFLDLTLAAVDGAYYAALRSYHRGLAERNRLLKRGGGAAELAAFEAEIAPHAVAVAAKRRAGVEALGATLSRVYAGIAEKEEGPRLRLRPSDECATEEAVRAFLRDGRARDALLGATQKGPHRDDLSFALEARGAREYASDGQQRGLCVALRLAQARFFEDALGLRPVLLADDVLGELDPHRKAGFWRACPAGFQIIATGTELPPDASVWAVWRVAAGRFNREA